MKNLILAAAFLLPSAVLAAQAVEVDARALTCNQIVQTIRQHKAVFVRTGFGGRSFRYPPSRCSLGDRRVTVSLQDINRKRCTLDYACVGDPNSIYNMSTHP
ncbi:hypothetical protein [Rhizobium sp. BK251]|uniref:hypothetical protein n=1 Tax=Rhizobium sp. BK251 TaxID=2512125 RepID=UPI0010474960|nr:hypothetical protein [Rhizobium sp. BK251]TCL70670.1 hypothetical protein EV286_107548 [Rhizobium sp. BK251]